MTLADFLAELWRPVPGYEGLYEVSDQGRVRSTGRVLRTKRGAKGYLRVGLSREGQQRWHYVHRLVLLAWVGPPPAGTEACHNNGMADDNRLVNLRWGTRSENTRDMVSHGTHDFARRTHCPRSHLLDTPNIEAWALRRGRRTCLACSRARAYLRCYPDAGDLQTISDRYYAAIMEEGAAS